MMISYPDWQIKLVWLLRTHLREWFHWYQVIHAIIIIGNNMASGEFSVTFSTHIYLSVTENSDDLAVFCKLLEVAFNHLFAIIILPFLSILSEGFFLALIPKHTARRYFIT